MGLLWGGKGVLASWYFFEGCKGIVCPPPPEMAEMTIIKVLKAFKINNVCIQETFLR